MLLEAAFFCANKFVEKKTDKMKIVGIRFFFMTNKKFNNWQKNKKNSLIP
jgi:hypothetical protein